MLRLSGIGLAAMMTSCTLNAPARPVSAPVEPAGDDACSASRLQTLVGKPAAAARDLGAAGAGSVRVLGPDDIVTMEFDGRRLTVRTDRSGTIVSIACG